MQKTDIAKKMARRSGVTQAEAADQLDRVVQQIVSNLRKGRDTKLPGLGKFSHAKDGSVIFKREGSGRNG
jgi:nucleoid DNA-binding protein